jgi:hypothetical protein
VDLVVVKAIKLHALQLVAHMQELVAVLVVMALD